MTIIGSGNRGAFRIVNLDTQAGQGVQVTIGGAKMGQGGSAVGSASLVTSFSADQSENYSVSQCLNGGVFLYTFGHDPAQSTFSLGVASFLSSCRSGGVSDFANALSAYQAGRVSRSKALSTLSVGDATLRGYLVSQRVSVVSNELSMISTVYSFVAISPQGVLL